MHPPSWILLAWSGFAATAASLGTRALFPAPAGAAPVTRIARNAALGLFALPPFYGLLFEALGRADIATGALLGAVHGLLEAAIRSRHALDRRRIAIRSFAGAAVYGITIGFVYLVPA